MFDNSKIRKIIIIYVSLIIVVVAIFGLVKLIEFITAVPEVEYVDIVNFSDMTNAPVGYKKVIQEKIWPIIKEAENLGDDVNVVTTIRGDKFKEERKNNNIVTTNFILDVEQFHYSFDVSMSWRTDTEETLNDPTVIIRCPHYLDVIYTDKKCIAETPIEQLKRYLPHYEYLSNGSKVAATMKNKNQKSYLNIEVDACGNQVLKDEATQVMRKWMESIYIDSGDIDIEIFDTCK